MSKKAVKEEDKSFLGPLPQGFNKKNCVQRYAVVNNANLREIQGLSKRQCFGDREWPQIDKVNAWMISAETGTFMKGGGLGVIASELPEAYNVTFSDEKMTVVTPMYLGDTKRKKAVLENDKLYIGAEHKQTEVKKLFSLKVPFIGDKGTLVKYVVDVYAGKNDKTDYLFLRNDRFFSINPDKKNPCAQDGCYVLNEFGINEVEKFAFFSKAVYVLVKSLCNGEEKAIEAPNTLIANDWHSGALSGLLKYYTSALVEAEMMQPDLAEKLKNIPIIHIVHHMGYQGWDYENTTKILNSLYENTASIVYKNAKAIKNANPRIGNVLIVYDCYNQASCNLHLADRVVTVSKNYLEEVSKDIAFGFDFRDILKIRKDHRSFFGIINGYEKKLISPNKDKIEAINKFFGNVDFRFYDEENLDAKLHNKEEFVKLLCKLAKDKTYKNATIPLVDVYGFEDISKDIKDISKVPVVCATSRLVEQKGYDIATQSIINLLEKANYKEYPIFVLGGAGDEKNFALLQKLKDKVAEINPQAAKRIYVFRGYKDEFAYAVQLASDFYLMPSHFEPCGLTQMEAMAKGTIPIATSTGGLVDTIDDGVNGFRTEVFFGEKKHVYGTNIMAKRVKTNERAYAETLQKALDIFYRTPKSLKEITKAAMKKDFSWTVPETGSVYKYYKLLHTGHI